MTPDRPADPSILYAPHRPKRRRRAVAAWLVTLAVLGGAGWRYGPWAYVQGKVLLNQRAAVAYQSPPGSVVMDSKGRVSVGNPSFDTALAAGRVQSPAGGAFTPALVAAYVGYVEVGGRTYLLHIGARDVGGGIELESTLFRPAGLRAPMKVVAIGWLTTSAAQLSGLSGWADSSEESSPGRVRLRAGRPDPGDPTRILMPFDVDGAEGVLGVRILAAPDNPTGTPRAESVSVPRITGAVLPAYADPKP